VLKQRVLTAIILVPLVIGGIFALTALQFSIILALFVLLGAWEWTRLVKLDSLPQRLSYLFVLSLLLIACSYLRIFDGFLFALLGISVIWWLANIRFLISFRESQCQLTQQGWGWGHLGQGLMLLIPAWLSLVVIHSQPQHGPWLLLYLMVLIWVADSGAYFSGRKWGRNKLAPHVSPGKTREGLYGAVTLCLLFSVLAVFGFDFGWLTGLFFVVLSMITVVFSVLGDLLESAYKRRAGVKDSGAILPGHGGILDRIDSMTAAAPVFALGLGVMELMV